MRCVSPVCRSLDGWGQRGDCHDNDTGQCHAKKLEGERAVRQRLTQIQCAMEITVDREQADRRKLLDEEAKAVTNWLQQAFTEFGARLRQQVQRKSLEENAEEDERQSCNRAEQAIWKTQHQQLEEETTKLKDQQAELVTTARRLVERSSGLLEIFEQRLQEVKMTLNKMLRPLVAGQQQIQELRSRVEVLPTHDQVQGYLQQLASKYDITRGSIPNENRTHHPRRDRRTDNAPPGPTSAERGPETGPAQIRGGAIPPDSLREPTATPAGNLGTSGQASGKMQRREQFQQASSEGDSGANVKRTKRGRRGGQRVQPQRLITRLVQLLFQGLHA